MDKLDYLISYLIKERNQQIEIPSDIDKKRDLYKTLCNIREPGFISDEYVRIENDYLKEELNKKGIVEISSVLGVKNKKIRNRSKLGFWLGDITRLRVGAIVNPANSQGLGCFNPKHRCLDNIIGLSAGVCLRNECNEIMKKKDYNLETGEAFITKGYNLAAKYIIHTVGPIINFRVSENQKLELAKCYKSCLELAYKNNIRTVAFPCISTGLFSFPKELAASIAIKTVDEYLDTNNNYFDKIIFCVFTDEDYRAYKEILDDVNS